MRMRSGLLFSGLLLANALFSLSAHANSSMATGALTSQPIGHFDFCKKNVAECRIHSVGVQPLSGGNKTFALISAVNERVNAAILPETEDRKSVV